MPCRDYESDSPSYYEDYRKMKKQADRLARMACSAMEELERNGIAEVLLLKNDEVREWWAAHKEADRKERARVAELQRREAVKQEALNKLSNEEKELLGLTKPKAKSKSTTNTVMVDEIEKILHSALEDSYADLKARAKDEDEDEKSRWWKESN